MDRVEKDFLLSIVGLVKNGWDPWAVYVHAWHETGAFTAVIGRANFWGIKTPRTWTGKVVTKKTKEYNRVTRENVTVEDRFADWPGEAEAMLFYESLVRRLYPGAFRWRSFPSNYFMGLVMDRYQWATDPDYERKLRRSWGICLMNKELVDAINMVKEVAEDGGKLTFL